ncbi:dihydrolipoyl dehydrogenase [Aquabacter cavernae]|uniref:dihydrolipoyl dehydrogenase n=1 Tax=Aquabacter cavernae TaxID=2496029 RepID=UPI000F8EF263|nr:dihydrolipoyl dehydrogenase [Aquabacter cavernae]
MTTPLKTRLLVVGGGPGGYVAAIRAGQLGIDTILVDEGGLGGTCLQRGCIPSKALIEVATRFAHLRAAAEGTDPAGLRAGTPSMDFAQTRAWKDGIVTRLADGVAGLLRRAKVRHLAGRAVFSDAKTCRVETGEGAFTIAAEAVILATGSEPVELPALPFGGGVVSSTQALSLSALPECLAVVGAGYIGLELGIAFAKLGVSVSVVERQDRILPLYDRALTEPVRRALERHGISLHLSARALGHTDGALAVEGADGTPFQVPADLVLSTVGRRPRLEGFGLEAMAVDVKDGRILVDDQCRTSMSGVFAIGDVIGEPMLAHKAMAQGEMVAEIVAGHRRRFDPLVIPAVCFTDPEIVVVGLSPEEAGAPERALVGTVPFLANGRALTLDAPAGFVRVVARREDHVIVGVQAVGAHVSELSAAFVTAIEMGARLEDVAGMIHAHPTLGEAFHEAALAALSGGSARH